MTRTRTTPYPAQLDRLLNDAAGEHGCFSASTLAGAFEHPRKQTATSTLSGIHKALFRAWGAGKLISFVDVDGGVLREDTFGAPGSAAVEHPQIFARAGTPSPQPGYEPVTYAQYSASRHDASALDDLDEDEDEDDVPMGEAEVENIDDELTADDVVRKLQAWRPRDLPPLWVPETVLCRWVSLGKVLPHWRAGLDQAAQPERAKLIRLGVGRKGPIAEDSLTARGLAKIVRDDLFHWKHVAGRALAHYAGAGEIPAAEDLLDLASDPLGYYVENSELPGHLVLLTGLALELDESALEEIATDIAEGSDGREPSVEEQLRFQMAGRESEISELRGQLRDAKREASSARKEQQALAGQLDRLRDADQRAGTADEELAAERDRARAALAQVAELEAAVDGLSEDAKHVTKLESDFRALEALYEERVADAPSVDRERRLREQAEAEVQMQLRRVREVTQQLHDATEQRVQLPVDDGPALISALAAPVAAAAQHALGRMAERAALPGDVHLLRFAATFAALSDDMPAAIEMPAAEATEPAIEFAAAEEPAAALDDAVPATDMAPAPDATLETVAVDLAVDDGNQESVVISPRRRPRRPAMPFTIRAIGGASEVGGSAIVVQTRNGANVLLDAGQRVKGEFGAESVNQFHYGVPGTEGLDAILISHAHIDHIGSLPLIHQHQSELRGSAVPVVMTEPTKVLGEIMLNDSAKIQHYREMALSVLAESDYGAGAMEAAYSFPDVSACLDVEHLILAEAYKPIPIEGTSLVARFLPVAHVLGSCAVHLKDTETGATLLYSGDLGPITDSQLTLPDFGGTGMIDGADVIIMESTYGLLRDEEREGRRRASHGRERATRILADIAGKTLQDGGHILLPAFSLGRTQELAMLIDRERGRSMPDGKIYVAGMGESITEKYADFDRPRGGWRRPGDFPPLTSVRKWLGGGNTFEDVVAEVLESAPSYIIASPAMVSSGWSRAFMEAMIGDPRHAVVFTGYLPKHAGNIPNLREMHQGKTMRLNGENREIQCRWQKISLSAHAPSSDLELFAHDVTQGRDSAHIGLVHGAPEAQRELAERLTDKLDGVGILSLRNGEPWIPGRS